MAKYSFKKDASIAYYGNSGAISMALPNFKQYKKGDVIEGKSFDKGKTISTTLKNQMPQEMIVGEVWIPIPIENLELVSDDSAKIGSGNNTPATDSKFFTTKNIVIISVSLLVLGVGGYLLYKKYGK